VRLNQAAAPVPPSDPTLWKAEGWKGLNESINYSHNEDVKGESPFVVDFVSRSFPCVSIEPHPTDSAPEETGIE